jgi:hypothetical protein
MSVFHFPNTDLGTCGQRSSWETWKGVCVGFNHYLKLGLGIFCANVASTQGSWKPCRLAWCGKCYVPTRWEKFPVKVLKTEDGLPMVVRLQDKHKFHKARNGDFLMCTFQCDLCHFRNIQKRVPGRDAPDVSPMTQPQSYFPKASPNI